MVHVRTADAHDLPWIRALLDTRWGGQEQVANGEAYRPADLPGFLAVDGDAIVGYACLRPVPGVAEIGLIDVLRPRDGVGRALVDALAGHAGTLGLPVLRAITTNDNLGAQAFYRALGFRLVATRPGAVNESRRIKPQIPLAAPDGTPITDELEFERPLTTTSP
jgi:ribosomal protein S18 acetylase RimI-like enzyme